MLIYSDFRNNQLTGGIPASLGSLSKLNYLYLYNNQLSGPIPDQLGSLSQLIYLNLYNNKLSGPIPPSFGDLSQLTTMHLHRNQLTKVPATLSSLTGCKVMNLLPNPISSIPYDIEAKNPVSTLDQSLKDFLFIPIKAKRQMISNVGTLKTADLLKMCPLSRVDQQDILAGCMAGIVYFCQGQREVQREGQRDLTQCHQFYTDAFERSLYRDIYVCAPWKSGPKSTICTSAVKGFSVSLEYTTVNMQFANFFATTLFTNPLYAPCNNTKTVKCNPYS